MVILISEATVYVTEYPVKTNAGKVKTMFLECERKVTFVVKRL